MPGNDISKESIVTTVQRLSQAGRLVRNVSQSCLRAYVESLSGRGRPPT